MAAANTPKKPFHIAVIGGGIGGLCLTIGLLHHSIPCTLYESAAAFAEIGAGVSFGPNAIRAMSLIDPAIKTGYDRIATSNAWEEKRKLWFDFNIGVTESGWRDLNSKTTEHLKEGARIAQPVAGDMGQSSVHRAHFLDALVRLIPDGVANFGKRIEDVSSEQNGKMKLTFADGTIEYADAVIGCDGIKSRTRQLLLGVDHPNTNPSFTGKYAYRGLVPMEKAVGAIGDELARNSQMYLGRHGHILTFPIEQGKTMNVVAFQSKLDGKWDHRDWVLPMKREDMEGDFEGWGTSAKKILSLMEKPDVWALFDHPPAPTYYKGRFALLGDAAHASTPHQGAGAGQAIEDAFTLSNILGSITSPIEIENAFRAYDAVRRPRSQKVVETSREAAAIYDFEDEKLGVDLDLIKRTLETRFDWIWNEDLPAQLKRAMDVMKEKGNVQVWANL